MSKKIIARNKKVKFNYYIEDTLEVGISLVGSEVKSLRLGQVNIDEGHITINDRGQLRLLNVHIKEFKEANINNHEPRRSRQLLAHKKQILKLESFIKRKGFTLMPLDIYFSGKWVKLTLAMCKGKKLHDKRDVQKERDSKRELDRVQKSFNNK